MEREIVKYWVPQVSPYYIHWKCLIPVAKSLAYKNGGEYYEGKMPQEPCVVIGHHLLTELPPKGSIIVNTEYHLDKIIQGYELWDILDENNGEYGKITRLGWYPMGINQASKVPIYECDVLFSGAMNERRAKIIQQLLDSGIEVNWVNDVYEEELTPYILSAKIVLDVHFYEKGRFNILRLLTAMSYSKAVVSESKGGYYGGKLAGGYVATDYSNIVNEIESLLNDNKKRSTLEQEALQRIQTL